MVNHDSAALLLTPDERQFLAEALLLRRYVNHGFKNRGNACPTQASEVQAHIALRIARRLGLFPDYWLVMQDEDVLTVKIDNLDAAKKRGPYGPRGKYKTRKPHWKRKTKTASAGELPRV